MFRRSESEEKKADIESEIIFLKLQVSFLEEGDAAVSTEGS